MRGIADNGIKPGKLFWLAQGDFPVTQHRGHNKLLKHLMAKVFGNNKGVGLAPLQENLFGVV